MKPFLETERLLLYAPEKAHYEDLCRLLADPDVMRYIGRGPRSPEAVRQQLETLIDLQDVYGYSLCAVYERASRAFIGRAGLCQLGLDVDTDEVEVGYAFFKEYWGRGYGVEIGKALIEWAFENLEVARVLGVIQPENEASGRLLEKCGMQFNEESLYDGIPVYIYSISRKRE